MPTILYKGGDEHGNIEKLFWGRVPIERATSGLRYNSDEVRRLVHAFKYHGQPQVATDIAEILAEELAASDFFAGIDAIVPMPLHWLRLLKRSYNQCDYIARGIQKVTHIPIVTDALRRTRNNRTQTHLTAIDRTANVADIFALHHADQLQGKHVLLVDDVMTTGSTLLSAMQVLHAIPEIRLSVFTIAYAGMVQPELV